MHWVNHEITEMNIREISNKVCPIKSLFKDQMF